MGGGHSQEDYQSYAAELYELSSQSHCVLPDVSIDEALLKYSALYCNYELHSYASQLLNSVPDLADKVTSGLGVTTFPNAVGLGALVISMLLEIVIKSSASATEDSYSLIERVFGDYGNSGVRDKMSEYLKRHRRFITDDQRLLEEMRSFEQQLSSQLTSFRNSLLYNGQMSSRGLKIWVNGAFFHVQMLIHEARLNTKAGNPLPKSVSTIKANIDTYLQDLNSLLNKYQTYKSNAPVVRKTMIPVYSPPTFFPACSVFEHELNCQVVHHRELRGACDTPELTEAYLNHVFVNYEPILMLSRHFHTAKNNVDFVIRQHDTFTVSRIGKFSF